MRGLHMEHGPDAVRREFAEHVDRVPSHWIRMGMAGCQKCTAWQADRRRAAGIHRAYRRRRR